MKRLPAVCLVVLLAVTAACAANSAAPGGSGPDRITQQQIEGSTYNNAFDLVQALRPQWLRRRGAHSINRPGEIVVYVDNVRAGGVGELRTIALNGVYGLRYYSGQAASQRWGIDHGDGVIQVHTRPPTS